MDYEQKYNKLVEAVKVLQEANPSDEGIQNWVNDNVPELRESEDERIRKAIIEFFELQDDNTTYSLIPKKDILAWLEKQGEVGKLAEETQVDNEDSCINTSQLNSEANQDYNAKFKVGSTFTGLIPCWVCAPSTLQPAHKYNGKNVVVVRESNGVYRCICVDDVKPVTFHLPEGTSFVEGWRRKLSEWTEEDDKMADNLSKFLTNDFGMFNKDTLNYKRWLCKIKSKRLC